MGEGGAQEGPRAAAGSEAAARTLVDEAERVAASLSGRLADAPAAEPESPPDDYARAHILDPEDEAARPAAVMPEAAARAPGAASGAPPEAVLEIDEARADGGDEVRAGDDATPPARETRGGVRGRAAAVGASVGGSLKPRVERLREASSVVIDEAADDPGVRFLVIAVVLFLLFLLLWLLSFTLG